MRLIIQVELSKTDFVVHPDERKLANEVPKDKGFIDI